MPNHILQTNIFMERRRNVRDGFLSRRCVEGWYEEGLAGGG